MINASKRTLPESAEKPKILLNCLGGNKDEMLAMAEKLREAGFETVEVDDSLVFGAPSVIKYFAPAAAKSAQVKKILEQSGWIVPAFEDSAVGDTKFGIIVWLVDYGGLAKQWAAEARQAVEETEELARWLPSLYHATPARAIEQLALGEMAGFPRSWRKSQARLNDFVELYEIYQLSLKKNPELARFENAIENALETYRVFSNRLTIARQCFSEVSQKTGLLIIAAQTLR